MERDRIVIRKRYLERRGATVMVIDGRLEVKWPAQTDSNTTPVGINKVMRGEGKKQRATRFKLLLQFFGDLRKLKGNNNR